MLILHRLLAFHFVDGIVDAHTDEWFTKRSSMGGPTLKPSRFPSTLVLTLGVCGLRRTGWLRPQRPGRRRLDAVARVGALGPARGLPDPLRKPGRHGNPQLRRTYSFFSFFFGTSTTAGTAVNVVQVSGRGRCSSAAIGRFPIEKSNLIG